MLLIIYTHLIIKKRDLKIRQEQEIKREKSSQVIESNLALDLIQVEVGYGLIESVQSNETGGLIERISAIRKQCAIDMGVIVPSIHIVDNVNLESGTYHIKIKGNTVAEGVLKPNYILAMRSEDVKEEIEGIKN